MRVGPTAGARRWKHHRRPGHRVAPGALAVPRFLLVNALLLTSLMVTACAGTSTRQVAGESETTTTADTTTSTTTPPDCAATLPTTALASQLLMVMVTDPSQAAEGLSTGIIGGFGLKGEQRSDVDEAITAATSDLPPSCQRRGGRGGRNSPATQVLRRATCLRAGDG
ncbi:MAG: hypothetical protein M5U19_10800 [Microthrixaceae bacterium]|nr:hypothetical protein [Microthrixaceae bacterium]